MAQITIQVIEKRAHCNRFKISGQPTNAEYLASDTYRASREQWCEFTIWTANNSNHHLGSYGGECWPFAWPELFTNGIPSAQSGRGNVYLTDKGVEAIEAALMNS